MILLLMVIRETQSDWWAFRVWMVLLTMRRTGNDGISNNFGVCYLLWQEKWQWFRRSEDWIFLTDHFQSFSCMILHGDYELLDRYYDCRYIVEDIMELVELNLIGFSRVMMDIALCLCLLMMSEFWEVVSYA